MQDVRHNFSFDASYDVPSEALVLATAFRDGSRTAGRYRRSRSSGRLAGERNATGGVFGGFSLRPDLVPGVDPYNAPNSPTAPCVTDFSVPDCQFNPAAFSVPAASIFPETLRETFFVAAFCTGRSVAGEEHKTDGKYFASAQNGYFQSA